MTSATSTATHAPSRNGSPLATLEGVGVHLGYTRVLRGLDLSVEPGSALGVVGANGSGKTTLLRLLATLLRPSEGEARVLDADLRTEARLSVRQGITFLGHEPSAYPHLTLEENLTLVARLRGVARDRVGEILENVGLLGARHRLARQCSQGMLRRADFARALVCTPRLLLLDEAHAGLDAACAGLVDQVVAGVVRGGGSAVLVSHDRARLDASVDHVLELSAGRLRSAR